MYGIPLRFIVYLVVAAMMAGLGYYAKYEHDQFLVFKATAAQAAADQDRAAKQKDIENDQARIYIAQSYADELNRLRHNTSSGKLPKAAGGSSSPNAAESELSGACKGSEFYNNALEDALKLQMWQEWARKLDLPVGN